MRENQPDAILTDFPTLHDLLESCGFRVPQDVGLAVESVLDGNADAGIYQNPEEIGRVAFFTLLSHINDHSLGVPPIFLQNLVAGRWVDGSTLPQR